MSDCGPVEVCGPAIGGRLQLPRTLGDGSLSDSGAGRIQRSRDQAALESDDVLRYSCAMYSHARIVRAMVVSVGPQVPLLTKQLLSVTKTFFASQHWLYSFRTDFAGSLPMRAPPHSCMAAPSAMLLRNERRNMKRSNQPAFGMSLSGSSRPSRLAAKSIDQPAARTI